MKLYRFSYRDYTTLGVEVGGKLVDICAGYELYRESVQKKEGASTSIPRDMTAFLGGDDRYLEAAGEVMDYVSPMLGDKKKQAFPDGEKIIYDFDEIDVKSPISHCSNIIGIGVNYESHLKETGKTKPDAPILFFKQNASIVDPMKPIKLTDVSVMVDYEVELAVIIGKKARNIFSDKVYDYIAGYTVINDITDRGVLLKTWEQLTLFDWFLAKAQDGFAPLGPCIVTKDEIPDPHNLKIGLKLNDELKQDSTTGEMIMKIPELIEFITRYMTLEPGDVIATGTPAGVGLFTGSLLKDGDMVEASIEGIGTLKNPVIRV